LKSSQRSIRLEIGVGLGTGFSQGKAEDAGGLTSATDDNAAMRKSSPRTGSISGRMEHYYPQAQYYMVEPGDTVEVVMSTYSHFYPDKMAVMAEDLDRQARGESPDTPGTASLADVADRLDGAKANSGLQGTVRF